MRQTAEIFPYWVIKQLYCQSKLPAPHTASNQVTERQFKEKILLMVHQCVYELVMNSESRSRYLIKGVYMLLLTDAPWTVF